MITALCLKTAEQTKGIKKLINKLRPDIVKTEIKSARGVTLKEITYISYNGKLHLEKIDEAIGANRNRLLCSEKLSFPENCGYRRFSSNDFTARLCANIAVSVLEFLEDNSDVKVGIYDPDGDSHDVLLSTLRYCSSVTVVTDYPDSFYCELNRALDEMGASAVITKNRLDLADVDLVIAPCIIDERLPVRSNSLVLTAGLPTAPQNGLIYYKYSVRIPNGFNEIRPKYFDEVYFCSALYTLAGQYELGSMVPTACRSYSSSQTVASLAAYIKSMTAQKTLEVDK